VALEDNFTTTGQKTALYLQKNKLASIKDPANMTPAEIKIVIDFLIEQKKASQFRVATTSAPTRSLLGANGRPACFWRRVLRPIQSPVSGSVSVCRTLAVSSRGKRMRASGLLYCRVRQPRVNHVLRSWITLGPRFCDTAELSAQRSSVGATFQRWPLSVMTVTVLRL